jgi:FK506-binding protein 1
MKVVLSLAILFCCVTLSLQDTSDPEFVKKFQVKHLEKGDGKNFPQPGNKVSVHYTGTFPETGKKFDSSRDRNQKFSFTLKRGQVIQCWDEVVGQMSKGEKIYVICPSKLAYGERGAGGAIPPNADIAFEIELFDFSGPNSDL